MIFFGMTLFDYLLVVMDSMVVLVVMDLMVVEMVVVNDVDNDVDNDGELKPCGM